MIFSDLSWSIRGTLGRKYLALAQQYDDVINFTLGDPDIPTPDGICEAAIRCIREHRTRYTASAGIPQLREAIAQDAYGKTGGVDLKAENVAITVGATEAIHLAFRMLLNPGDEVIIIGPTWAQCPNDVLLCGAKPIIADKFASGFLPDLDYLRTLVTDKTKIIVVNSPNNPTGTVYPKELLKGIAELASEKGLYVFSDEVYSALVYDKPFTSISSFFPLENMVIFNSFSKAFCMTGWRVGCVIGEAHFIKRLVKMQENVAVCASSISQWAALEAITHADQYYPPILEKFRARRKVLLEALKGIPHLKYEVPDATFYLFTDISETGLDSRAMCTGLLEKEHVAITPGLSFGDAFDSYIRLAFTLEEDVIREGIGRIRHFMESLD